MSEKHVVTQDQVDEYECGEWIALRDVTSIGVAQHFYDAGRASRDAEVEKLREDAERYRWQPIETAPKDATRVLIRGGGVSVGVAGFERGAWWFMNDCYANDGEPTQWMPVPAIDQERNK